MVQLYNIVSPVRPMLVTVDPSALMAVILNEETKAAIVSSTREVELIAPASVPWEVGNALVAQVRCGIIAARQSLKALIEYERIPIRLVDVDLPSSLEIAFRNGTYAYDAYVLECARRFRTPLLSLDRRQREAAVREGIALLEIRS